MKKAMALLLTLALMLPSVCFGASAVSFEDIPTDYWASAEIAWAAERGLMNGTSATTFDPGGETLRGQMTVILYRYAGSPAVEPTVVYTDVKSEHYYSDAAIWAVENSIMEQTRLASETMDAAEPISRAEFCTMLMMFSVDSGTYIAPSADTPFTDTDDLSEANQQAIAWAYNCGIVNGTSATAFSPDATLNRAAAAAMLCRYENKVVTATPAEAENKASQETVTETTPASSNVTSSEDNQTSDGGNSVTAPLQAETEGYLVWVPTNGGIRYHSSPNCSKMIDPIQVSIETAKAHGFTACGRCHPPK